MSHGRVPLVPKSGNGSLKVILIGRISTEHQNEESIEASFASDERYLRELYSGLADIVRLGERGSGWKINRETIKEAERLIQTRQFDVVIMEHIGRAYRNPQFQFRLAHMCKDHATRLICPGDAIDTAEPHWEVALQTAVLRHGLHVPDTRRRVRRSATYSFHKGGMVLKTRAFYRKLSEKEAAANGGVRITRRGEYEPIVREMRLRVLRGDSYERVARWLNAEQIDAGPYVKLGRWTGRLVKDFLADPILYGLRTFRDMEHELIFSTGEHRRIPNATPETKMIPELAFMTAAEHSELVTFMNERAVEARSPDRASRRNVARKESYWPGQHLVCSCCGELMYWAGRSDLKCKNAYPGRPQSCWNRGLVDADLLRQKLLPRLLDELRKRPAQLRSLVDSVWESFRVAIQKAGGDSERLDSQIRKLDRDIEKITVLLVEAADSESLMTRLKVAENQRKVLRIERERQKEILTTVSPFQSKEDVQQHLEAAIIRLAASSYEFAALMRSVFPSFRLIPVVAVGTTQVRPRVRLGLPEDPESGIGPAELVVDAFECSAAITYAVRCGQLHREHPEWTRTRIGEELGISKKLACDAIRYARRLEEFGLTDPFVELVDPPAKASRWRGRTGETDRPDSGPTA